MAGYGLLWCRYVGIHCRNLDTYHTYYLLIPIEHLNVLTAYYGIVPFLWIKIQNGGSLARGGSGPGCLPHHFSYFFSVPWTSSQYRLMLASLNGTRRDPPALRQRPSTKAKDSK